MLVVNVQFFNDKSLQYEGKIYRYFCHDETVKADDFVVVETGSNNTHYRIAQVASVLDGFHNPITAKYVVCKVYNNEYLKLKNNQDVFNDFNNIINIVNLWTSEEVQLISKYCGIDEGVLDNFCYQCQCFMRRHSKDEIV